MLDAALKVLVFSKSMDGAEALLSGLGDCGFDNEWKWINTRDELSGALVDDSWDLMLSDDTLGTFDSIKTLNILEDAGLAVPYIVISKAIGMDRAVELMKAGCSDIIRQKDAGHLTSVVERELRTAENNRLKRRDEEKIRRQANYDSLTDLPNRALFFDRLSQALKRARREDGRLAIQFLDLDHFKRINDRMGHTSGDRLLQEAARRLESCIRESDTVARIGGDEFAIILSNADGAKAARIVARKILDSFARTFRFDGHTARTTVSIGIAFYPIDGDNAETLLANADLAMYQAKKQGRDMVCDFHPRMLPGEETGEEKRPEFSLLAWRSKAQKFLDRMTWAMIPRRMTLALVGLAAAGWLVAAALTMTTVVQDELQIAVEENEDTLGNFTTASDTDEKSTPEMGPSLSER